MLLVLTVRSWAGDQVEPNLFGGSEERLPRKHAFCREVSRSSLERSPIDIEGYTVVAESFNLLQYIHPEIDDGKAPRVELAGV